MIVTRVATDPAQFQYEIDFHQDGGADTDWPWLVMGSFQAGGTARRGTGSFDVATSVLRGEGLDPNLGTLDHMHVDYSTLDFPVTVSMDVFTLPDPSMPMAPSESRYAYKAAADGQGQLTFDMFGNLVAGPQNEQVTVTSQWLGSGQGRASLTVVSGDGAGLMQTECWDDQFNATFNDVPWSPADDVGQMSSCPTIPVL
jgi:hypothetical protein